MTPRDAATVILLRQGPDGPRVLMGQRGAGASFMPSKFVFPGGAVDSGDAGIALDPALNPICTARIEEDAAPGRAPALAAACIRELWEETGLILGTPAPWPDAPRDWESFAACGFRPSAAALRFVFRAITPPGRPRRFDARFFLADANALAVDPDDVSRASGELSALQWIALEDTRNFDLPFITEVVLAEIRALAAAGQERPETVPFFKNTDEESLFLRLNGQRV